MSLKRSLLCIMIIGAILRLIALIPYSLHHPDEIFQYLEQAHRLVFGYGVLPWEYRYGMRSWVVPLLITPLMKLGAIIAPSTLLYAKLPNLLGLLAGLSIIWSAWTIGKRHHPIHGFVAATVMAIWFEQVFFTSHLLTEVLATACILPAAALILEPEPTRRKLVCGGVLLGLAVVLRFQYGPALAVFALLACGLSVTQRWLPIIAGSALALLLSMMVDIAMGQMPFGWLAQNIQQNLILNRSADYGVSGPMAYFAFIRSYWHLAALPLFLLMLPTIRKNHSLLWMALANIAVHMAIGHKEYRFIFLSTTIFVMMAAIGSAELTLRLRERVSDPRLRKVYVPALLLLWTGLSATLVMAEPMRLRWNAYGPSLELAHRAGTTPRTCGIALHKLPYWEGGGYSYLHQKIPIYLTQWSVEQKMSQADIRKNGTAYNMIIASPLDIRDIPANFKQSSCAGQGTDINDPTSQKCLYVRQGSCKTPEETQWELSRMLLIHDQ